MKQIYKTLHIFLLIAAALFSTTSCSEEEATRFNSERGVNFLIYDTQSNSYQDDYTNLKTTINFYNYYLKGWDINEVSLKLGVSIEGTLSDQPVHVRLKTQPVEDYSTAIIEVPGDSIINPGEYRRTITVNCKRPNSYDTEERTNVTFDYSACGLVPGTKERQLYTVTLTDATDWSAMSVDNETKWNESYAATLGKYGPVKVRFIMVVLGTKYNYTAQALNNLYYYTVAYPNYGFKKELDHLKEALREYNKSHDTPLTEPDGTLVSFEPAN